MTKLSKATAAVAVALAIGLWPGIALGQNADSPTLSASFQGSVANVDTAHETGARNLSRAWLAAQDEAADATASPAPRLMLGAQDSAEVVVETVGELESEHPYAANTDETREYTLAGATDGIGVTFALETMTEPTWDTISIYDGDGFLVGTFSGDELAGKTVCVPNDTVRIRLKTDGSNEGFAEYFGYKVDNVFALRENDIRRATVECPTSVTIPLDGTPATPPVRVSMQTGNTHVDLEPGVHYSISYENNTWTGTGYVRIRGLGAYVGTTLAVPFQVKALGDFCSAELRARDTCFASNETYTPDLAATLWGEELSAADFAVREFWYTPALGSRNALSLQRALGVSKAGSYRLTVAGVEPYQGSQYVWVDVYPATDISRADVTLEHNVLAYTGEELSPVLRVMLAGEELGADDFALSFAKMDYETQEYVEAPLREAGMYRMTLTGLAPYAGEQTLDVRVEAAENAEDGELAIADEAYTGAAVTPVLAWRFCDLTRELVAGEGCSVAYFRVSNEDGEEVRTPVDAPIDVGTYVAVVSIEGLGGVVEGTFHVFDGRDLAYAVVDTRPFIYANDESFEPIEFVTLGGRELAAGDDYVVLYEAVGAGGARVFDASNPAPTTPGTHIVKLVGTAGEGLPVSDGGADESEDDVSASSPAEVYGVKYVEYEISKTARFDIAAATVSGAGPQLYTGEAIEPAIVVTRNGRPLVEGRDYVIAFENNVKIGTAYVVLTGLGEYAGVAQVPFAIKLTLDDETDDGQGGSGDGSSSGGSGGSGGSDGAGGAAGNGGSSSAGGGSEAGNSGQSGSGASQESSQTRVSIAGASVKVAKQVFTGKKLTPLPVVSFAGKKLVRGEDFTLSYANNRKAGTATVYVKGAGRYTGTKAVTFKIAKAKNPLKARARVKILRVSSAKLANGNVKFKRAAAFKIAKAKGVCTFSKVKGNKRIVVSKKGRITVKAGLAKGTYKVKVKVRAKGTANYKAKKKTVILRIRVR